jgi:hypothetical protein
MIGNHQGRTFPGESGRYFLPAAVAQRADSRARSRSMTEEAVETTFAGKGNKRGDWRPDQALVLRLIQKVHVLALKVHVFHRVFGSATA